MEDSVLQVQFRRESGFTGNLVSPGIWFRWESGFAGNLVSPKFLFVIS